MMKEPTGGVKAAYGLITPSHLPSYIILRFPSQFDSHNSIYRSTKSLVLIVGLPFTVPMEDSCLLSSLPWREDFWRLHLELGMIMKRKRNKEK